MVEKNNIFKIIHNGLLPLPGRLLISEPFLRDKYFQRSVILLVKHSKEQGSMGVILNKRVPLTLNNIIPDFIGPIPEIPIYFGGPVASDHLFFIHTLGDSIVPNAMKINDNLYFDGDFVALQDYIVAGNDVTGKVKFFIGYSGWQTDQLQKEIKDNSWVVGLPDDKNVFSNNVDTLWKHAVNNLGKKYHYWIHLPKDPYLN